MIEGLSADLARKRELTGPHGLQKFRKGIGVVSASEAGAGKESFPAAASSSTVRRGASSPSLRLVNRLAALSRKRQRGPWIVI